MTGGFVWDRSGLVVSPALHHFYVGNRPVVFCEIRQQLFGLNPTADLIWRRLAQGRLPCQVRRELVDTGVADAEARDFVQETTLSWLDSGYLTPREVLDQLLLPAERERGLRIHELVARIGFFGGAQTEPFDAVFGQFSDGAALPRLILSVVGCNGRFFTFDGDKPLGAPTAYEWIPRLKAVLTERYISAVENAFLVHGALLGRRNLGLLLCGSPGAGKTTLCAALVASGYDFGSDDIVRIDRDGSANGIPFAPAVKRGAWPLIAPYAPEVVDLPTYRRSDGQDVRYLPPRLRGEASRQINYVIVLSRVSGAPAVLTTIEPLEAVSLMLESAFSIKHSLDADVLRSFACTIERAGCYRLVYSDLAEAVDVLQGLIGE